VESGIQKFRASEIKPRFLFSAMASVCNALFTVKEKSGTIANSGKGGCKKANAKNGTNCGMCHAINDDKTRCNLPADGRTNYCKKVRTFV
jgi:hypothetical protein